MQILHTVVLDYGELLAYWFILQMPKGHRYAHGIHAHSGHVVKVPRCVEPHHLVHRQDTTPRDPLWLRYGQKKPRGGRRTVEDRHFWRREVWCGVGLFFGAKTSADIFRLYIHGKYL
jgi:hypothetical protein